MADLSTVDLAPGEKTVPSAAAAALGRWTPIVGMAPALASRESRAESLRRLVVWYEQVASDTSFSALPPMEGIDALVDELTSAMSSDAFDRLGCARWAVRVAEGLVGLRSANLPGASQLTGRTAAARLELALADAHRHLDGS